MVLLHLIYHKFKPEVSEAEIERMYHEDLNLKARMPGIVLGWTWYKNISLESRADVNEGFSHGVIVYVRDLEGLNQYLPHPEHLKVKALQGPMLEKIMCMDLEEQLPADCPGLAERAFPDGA